MTIVLSVLAGVGLAGLLFGWLLLVGAKRYDEMAAELARTNNNREDDGA